MKKVSLMIALLCASVTMFAASNVCGLRPPHPANGAAGAVSLYFNTADNGDVVVTLTPDESVTATFRSTGFEGDMANMKVLSGENFETSENLSEYFSMAGVLTGNTCTFYRTKTKNLPSPCKIMIDFSKNAFAWVEDDGAGPINAYDNNGETVIQYNYGTLCGSTLDAPVLAVDADGKLTFGAVVGATSYKAYVYQGSELIKTCPVTSGDKVFTPLLTGDYAFVVRAFNATEYSDQSNIAVWSTTGNPSGDMPKSTMCDYKLDEGKETEAWLSFYTDRSTGNFMITVEGGPNGDDTKTFFRDAGGMALSGFKYNGETLTDYFTRIPADNSDIDGKVNTLTFVPRTDEGHIPAYGGSITFASGNYVTWKTYNNGAVQTPWSDKLSFSYVYGTNCNELDDHTPAVINEVSVVNTTTSSATLFVDVTDKNDYNEARDIRKLYVRDETNGYEERKVFMDSESNAIVSDLKANTIYNFTVKALDFGGNITETTIKVTPTFDPEVELAFQKSCKAGYEYGTDVAGKAVDGKDDDHWGTYQISDYSENWWQVDLGSAYNLSEIDITFATSNTYKIEASLDEENWTKIVDVDTEPSAGVVIQHTGLTQAARYILFTALGEKMVAIRHFKVYGSGYYVPPTPPTAIYNTEAEVKAVKMIENGQLVIIKNGVKYNVLGKQL